MPNWGFALVASTPYLQHAIKKSFRHSIVASIPACHAGDQGSIPCDGVFCHIYGYYRGGLSPIKYAELCLLWSY